MLTMQFRVRTEARREDGEWILDGTGLLPQADGEGITAALAYARRCVGYAIHLEALTNHGRLSRRWTLHPDGRFEVDPS
jgi:hypothetical protein